MRQATRNSIIVAAVIVFAAALLWLDGPRTVADAIISVVMATLGMAVALSLALLARKHPRDQ